MHPLGRLGRDTETQDSAGIQDLGPITISGYSRTPFVSFRVPSMTTMRFLLLFVRVQDGEEIARGRANDDAVHGAFDRGRGAIAFYFSRSLTRFPV